MLPLSSQKICLLSPPPFSVIFIAFAFCPHLSRSISKVGLLLCLMFTYLLGCCHQYGNQGIFTNKLGTMHIFAFFPRLTLYGKHQYFVEIGSVSSCSLMKRSQPEKIEKASCQLKSFRDGKYHFFQKI